MTPHNKFRFSFFLLVFLASVVGANEKNEAKNTTRPAQTQKGKEEVSDKVPMPEEESVKRNRFIEKPGTGRTEALRLTPSSTLSSLPTGTEIEHARAAAGVPLDSVSREINLPGLKRDDPTLKPWVLHTRNGVNEVVKFSANLINRIATPFNRPIIVDSTESNAKIIGSDIYYTPLGYQPIGLFIVDSENRGQTISLTIIPTKGIPGQNLIVKMEDLRVAEDLVPGNPKTDKPIPSRENDYQGFVRSMMSNAIRGNIPGYSIVPLETAAAKIGHIDVLPDLVFSGQSNDVYRYKLVNKGEDTVDLYEPAFYRKGVKAISYFPKMSLAKGQSTYVFLLADKPSSGGEALQ